MIEKKFYRCKKKGGKGLLKEKQMTLIISYRFSEGEREKKIDGIKVNFLVLFKNINGFDCKFLDFLLKIV